MRRWLFACSSVVLAALTGVAACGFDDVTYADSTGEGGVGFDSATADVAAADVGEQDVGEIPHEILIDGSTPDALIAKDSGGPPIDAAGCAPSDCDCDKDGYKNTLKSGCGGGELDCDDSDPRARPGQLFSPDPPVLPQLGDWNCVGGVERLYETSFKCEGHLLGLGCADIGGFENAPQCGQKGSFITCKRASILALDCSVAKREERTQHCR